MTAETATAAVALVPGLQSCLRSVRDHSGVTLQVLAAAATIATIPEVKKVVSLVKVGAAQEAITQALICVQKNETGGDQPVHNATPTPRGYPWAENCIGADNQRGWAWDEGTKVRLAAHRPPGSLAHLLGARHHRL